MTYLSTAVSSMYPLLVKHPPRPDDLITAASIGCNALETLWGDPDFREHVSDLSNKPLTDDLEGTAQPGSAWKAGLLNEFPSFLGEVRKLMVEQNIPPGIVDAVCRQAEQLRRPVGEWRFEFNTFFDMIDRIRHDTCNLAQEIVRNRTNQVFLNEAQNRLLRITYVMTGLTCVSVSTLSLLNPDFNPFFRDFLLTLSGALASTYFSLAFQPPQFPSNLTLQIARRLFRRRVIFSVILVFILILSTFLSIKLTSTRNADSILTASTVATLVTYPLSFGKIIAYFYVNPNGSHNGVFDRTSSSHPVFTELFPTIDFNPDLGKVCDGILISNFTRPFTDIDNSSGQCKAIPAEGSNEVKAGVGSLQNFEAVFLTTIHVPAMGTLTMHISADDGWITSIGANGNGDQPTPIQTIMTHPPANKISPIQNYPEMGDNNVPSPLQLIKIHFPAAGTYPVEIDYTECCGGQLTLVVSNDYTVAQSRP